MALEQRVLRKRINQGLSRVPLRWVLTVPMLLLTAGSVGLVGYLSYRSGQAAVKNLANQLLEQVSNRVSDRLDNYLQNPQSIVARNRFAVEQGELDVEDFEWWQRYFQQQIAESDYLTTITVITPQGEMLGVGKDRNALFAQKDDFIAGELKLADQGQRRFYLLDGQGDRSELLRIVPIQDIWLRPWAQQAETSHVPFWTEVFSSSVVPSASIGAIAPIVQDGQFGGYFLAEIFLVDINNFLHRLRFSASGQAFIMERTGDLVATSTLEQPFIKSERPQPPVRLNASQSQDELTQLATAAILNQWPDLEQIQSRQRLRFTRDRQRFFTQVLPYRDAYGLDWLVVLLVPESDFMAEIDANRQRTTLLTVLTLLGATGLGVLLARSISDPILRLNRAARAIAQGNLAQAAEATGAQEVAQLAQSFQQMTDQLSQSLQAAHDSEQKFSTLLDCVPVGVTVFDASGQLILVNRAGQTILGQGKLDNLALDQISQAYHVYRAGTDQIYPTEHLPAVQALQGKTIVVDDVEIEVNGQRVPLEVHTIPVVDAQGTILYAINAFQDITERRHAEHLRANYNTDLERQVAEQTAELQKVSRLKDEFISIVAHELRTPLTAIRASLGLLDAGLLDDEPDTAQRMLRVASESSDRLVRLVNDVLNLERLESGKVQMVMQTCNVPSLMQQAVEAVEAIARESSITLSTKTLPVQVWAAPDAIVQTLINLLSNAVKYSAPGGTVWLRAEEWRSGKMGTQAIQNSKFKTLSYPITPPPHILFTVRDQGRGIPADQLDFIFDRFQQVDSSDSREKSGTGLGLAICKSIIQQHNGRIWAASTLDQGSTFYFTLPLAA